MSGHRDHTFGAGPDHLERIVGVRLSAARSGDTTCEVNHTPALEIDAAPGTHLAIPLEVGSKGRLNGFEASLHGAVDAGLDHRSTVLLPHRLPAPGGLALLATSPPCLRLLAGPVARDLAAEPTQ